VDLGQGIGDDLTGARPNGGSGARRLAGDGTTEGEKHDESVLGLTGARVAAWRQRNGGEEVMVEALSAGDAWAWREEKESGERCGEDRVGHCPFIGGQRGRGRRRGFMADVNALS
jgi:hypothetical protein